MPNHRIGLPYTLTSWRPAVVGTKLRSRHASFCGSPPSTETIGFTNRYEKKNRMKNSLLMASPVRLSVMSRTVRTYLLPEQGAGGQLGEMSTRGGARLRPNG